MSNSLMQFLRPLPCTSFHRGSILPPNGQIGLRTHTRWAAKQGALSKYG